MKLEVNGMILEGTVEEFKELGLIPVPTSPTLEELQVTLGEVERVWSGGRSYGANYTFQVKHENGVKSELKVFLSEFQRKVIAENYKGVTEYVKRELLK